MDAEEPGGERSPQALEHLQPEVGRSIAPVSHQLLLEFETGEGFSDDERDEARKASASMARRAADAELYERLAARGFAGSEYEVFRNELAAYAFPVLRSWIRRGVIFKYCADRGRPPGATQAERSHLAESNEDRLGLAMETAAEALNLFRTHAMVSGAWTAEGGASLKTYFVGACLQVFANVYRRWQRTDGKHLNEAAGYGLDPELDKPDRRHLHPALDADPADVVVSNDTVLNELAAMNPQTRDVAARIVINDETFAEAGEAAGISERAVEGRLYRYRTEAARRREERDKQ